MLQSSTPPAKTQRPAPLTTRLSSGVYRQPSITLQNSTPRRAGQNAKESPKKQPIIEYSPRRPQDTKPLRSYSGNRAMILLKGHLII